MMPLGTRGEPQADWEEGATFIESHYLIFGIAIFVHDSSPGCEEDHHFAGHNLLRVKQPKKCCHKIG